MNGSLGRAVDGHVQLTRTCTFCEAACGLVVSVDDRAVLDVRGDVDDPASRGYLCGKARLLARNHADPRWHRAPLQRVGHTWQPIGWEAALDAVSDRVAHLVEAHGPDSVGVVFGNPTAYDYATVFFSRLLLMTLTTRNRYSAASVDGLPHLVAARLVFGNQLLQPVPDIDRTDLFLVLGANPVVSNGSMMSAPGVRRRLAGIRRRGGRVIVVDPRRTETARLADRHLFIRPGTDAVFLLGLLHVVLREFPVRAPKGVGDQAIADLRDLSAPWDENRASRVTAVPASAIAEVARQFASAPRAVAYGRLGVAHQRHAVLCCWLITVLNIVTGNFDRPGGSMLTRPAVDLAALSRVTRDRGDFGPPTRVGRLPSFGGERPLATLADEIAVPGPGRIRGLILVGSNPVLSAPAGERLEPLFQELDLLVAIDPYVTESTRHAHYLLPPSSPLHRDQYPLITSLVAVRNTVKYVPRTLKRPDGEREEWEILGGLHDRLARRRTGRSRFLHRLLATTSLRAGPATLLNIALLMGPYGLRRLPRRPVTLSTLGRHPHGLDLGPLIPMARRRRIRIRLLPDELRGEVADLNADGSAPDEPQGHELLMLVGRRRRHGVNSWLHSPTPASGAGAAGLTLLIHPDDAQARAIAHGSWVTVRSEGAAVVVPALTTQDMMPGVVSLPHGIDSGSGHLNSLTDERRVDRLAGSAAFNGVLVSVEPCDDGR